MAKTWVKICGLTRAGDARAAVDLGADAIGVVCYAPSKRYLPPRRFAEVLAGLANEIEVFALFVNPQLEEVEAALATGFISGLQFHGDEPASFCESFAMPYMKAFRVRDDEDLPPRLADFARAQKILLDAFDASSYGGTGKSFRWELAAELTAAGHANIVIAGGLHAGNVAGAVRQVRPFGVDSSSGVEAAPGVKDLDKMRAFITEARNA